MAGYLSLWADAIPKAVEIATLEWVHWYNHQRLLAPLEYIPPAEAEANYQTQLLEQANRAAA